jgi:HK97 family phage portal protein
LIILLPDRTVTVLINGAKWHVVTMEDGSKVKIPDADVLHIPGLGFDGIQGYSLIEMAKNSIGLGLAAERHTNKHFKHNAMPGLVIEAPAGFFRDKKEAENFLKEFEKWHGGVDNTSRPALMREGMKATPLSMNGRDAQWIEQRIFQRQEAALWMVCEQILGDDSSVSYNSLEQKNLAYLTNCLNRWLVRWELELREKLLTGLQKRQETHYFKFNRNALLAMSANDRADFYTKMRAIEAISANEVREKEDMPPYDGGDTYDNPAINPKQTPEAGDSDKPEPKSDQGQTDDERMANLIAMVIAKIPPATASQVTVENRIDAPHAAVTAQLVTARLKEIAAVECHRASEAATKQKNFVAWLEDFYSDAGFLPRLRAVWQQVGGTDAGADAYALESKAMLLEAAGSATSPETLAATVAGLSGKWTARADEQAGLLLQGVNRG